MMLIEELIYQRDKNKHKEARFVNEEMEKLQARRLREYAEAQIEKERMRKLNQKITERDENFNKLK